MAISLDLWDSFGGGRDAETSFARDEDGNLIRRVQATRADLDKKIDIVIDGFVVKEMPLATVVKDAQGQRITVDGAVGQPGVYTLTGPTTLMQAVALAKGPDTKLANLHKVTVYRLEGAGRTSALYDLQAIRDGKKPDPLIFGKDVIVVDQSGGRSFLRDLGSVAPIVSMLRWGW